MSKIIITGDDFGLALPVDISLTNVSNAVSVEFAIRVDTTQLVYAGTEGFDFGTLGIERLVEVRRE